MKYLLDTNICIFYMKGMHHLDNKLAKVHFNNCFISEITLAELKFGVENSQHKNKNQKALNNFLSNITIVPIYNALDIYAKNKVLLRKNGLMIDDFDLLIGATAIANEMVLVTNNIKHMQRMKNIQIEDWTNN